MGTSGLSIPPERVERRILLIRGQKVMLDADLAELYGVATRVLNQAIRRNRTRFPPDFMFRLNREEFGILRSQFVSSSRWGGRRYNPLAFTEHGVAMLSSVLRSERAVQVNIAKAKGRPMLTWVGKRPLEWVTAFPAQLVEVFDPVAAVSPPPPVGGPGQ